MVETKRQMAIDEFIEMFGLVAPLWGMNYKTVKEMIGYPNFKKILEGIFNHLEEKELISYS